jgi:hypothetical protein
VLRIDELEINTELKLISYDKRKKGEMSSERIHERCAVLDFLATYSPNVEITERLGADVSIRGHNAMRGIWGPFFENSPAYIARLRSEWFLETLSSTMKKSQVYQT